MTNIALVKREEREKHKKNYNMSKKQFTSSCTLWLKWNSQAMKMKYMNGHWIFLFAGIICKLFDEFEEKADTVLSQQVAFSERTSAKE